MLFTSKEYLSHSEERIANLQKIVAGRPVAILAAGPSIKQLEETIEEFNHADICYFGMNKFHVQETNILNKINRRISVFTCSTPECIAETMSIFINFLNRNENNMFISSLFSDPFKLLDKSFSTSRFLSEYDKKLLFFSLSPQRSAPSNDYPLHFIKTNSLLILIQMALIAKASSIVLFGADGHNANNVKENYYRQNEYFAQNWPDINLLLMNDTMCYFNPIAPAAIKNTCKTYGLKPINILNCSLKSFYTPFPKISYNDAVQYLVAGKKIIGKLDLRVPAKPKMPNSFLLIFRKVINFWKKYKWNSFWVITARARRKKENYAR